MATLLDVVVQLELLQVDGGASGHRAREVEQLLTVDVSHVVQHGLCEKKEFDNPQKASEIIRQMAHVGQSLKIKS